MATLGTTGRNSAFGAGLTVPASMALAGYAVGGPGAAKWFRSLDLEGVVLGTGTLRYPGQLVSANKVAAVKAVLDAENLKYRPVYGGWNWATPNLGWGKVRLFFSHPAKTAVAAWDATRVNTLLAALDTALTT